MAAESTKGLTLYYCYAREDKALRDELDKHLGALKRLAQISTWHDGEIQAGTEWQHEIASHLQTANIILLLVSPDFLASEDAYHVEMTQALARHERGEALVIPVLLRPVDWEGTPMSKLQALPSDGMSVTTWQNRDEALRDIARGIRIAVHALLANNKQEERYSRNVVNEHASSLDDQQDPTNGIYQAVQSVFLYNTPLPDSKEFYGRSREYKKILDRIYKKSSISIVGPRRIGKTWLIQYVRLVAPIQLGSHFRVAYVDATSPSCASVTGFTSIALEELGIRSSPLSHGVTDLVHLERIVKDMRAQNHTLVLCIDEFEGMTNEDTFDLRFFTGLRAIAQAGLVLVIASKSPLIELVSGKLKTSPFFNIFDRLTLGPFSAKEAEAFIREKGAQSGFTEKECERLRFYGQTNGQFWIPVRLQLVGALLLEDKMLAEREDPDYYRPHDAYY